MLTSNLPALYKRTASGAIEVWQIVVRAETDGTATIVTTYGHVDGAQQTAYDRVTAGKNAGKKNATTPLEQALREAEAKWTKQRDRKHYGTDPGGVESAAKRAAAPMLAQDLADRLGKRGGIDWSGINFGQPKLDGHRMLVRKSDGRVSCVSRSGKDITTLDHLQQILSDAIPDGETFDGELYARPDELPPWDEAAEGKPEPNHFDRLASLIRRKQPGTEVIRYHVYDTVSPADYESRLSVIEDVIGSGLDGLVLPVETVRVDGHEHLQRLHEDWVAAGCEGAMLRLPGPYEAGKRSTLLLKVKDWREIELPVQAVREAEGNAAGQAMLVCTLPDGGTVSVLAPGTVAQKRAAWADREQLIGKLVTIKHFGPLTTNDSLRFPSALRWRNDV